MRKYVIPDLFISVGVIVAIYAFISITSLSYGMHSDSLPCGQNAEKVTYLTATQYYLNSSPFDESSHPKPELGTCPYDNFESRTLALDLWLISGGAFLSAIYITRHSRK